MIVNIELKGIQSVIADMEGQSNAVLKIAAMAINRAAKHGQVKLAQTVKRDFTLKARDIKKELEIRKANKNWLFAEIIIEGKPIPLIQFQTKGKGGGALLGSHALNVKGLRRLRNMDKVQVKVKRAGGYKTLSMAFIANGRYGVDVFRRTSKARHPIKAMRGPSIAGMVKDAVRMNEITRAIDAKLVDEFQRGLQYAIGKGRIGNIPNE